MAKANAETFTPAEQQAMQTGDTTALKEAAEQEQPEAAEAAPEAPEAAPEATEEVSAKPKGRQKTVPHEAFHEEREKRKAMEAELAPLKENYSKLEGRLQALLDMQRQPAPQESPKPQGIPKAEENIFGWAEGIQKKLEQIEGGVGQFQQQNEQQRVVSTLRNAYVADAERFTATAPDFQDAYKHLIAGRDQELQMLGESDPQRRQALIEMEELQIVSMAVKANRSPAEIAYSLAKARGYQPKAPDEQQQGNTPPRNPATGQFTAAEQIQRTAAKQQAAKSLSAVNGGSGGAEITSVTDILALNDEEFSAFMAKSKKVGDRPLAKIMGAN